MRTFLACCLALAFGLLACLSAEAHTPRQNVRGQTGGHHHHHAQNFRGFTGYGYHGYRQSYVAPFVYSQPLYYVEPAPVVVEAAPYVAPQPVIQEQGYGWAFRAPLAGYVAPVRVRYPAPVIIAPTVPFRRGVRGY